MSLIGLILTLVVVGIWVSQAVGVPSWAPNS